MPDHVGSTANERVLMHAIHYTIQPIDPHAHLFAVTVRIADPEPVGQRFVLPVWIPGSYMVREFARHIDDVTATVGRHAVTVTKVDKNSWVCARLPERNGALVLRYTVYAWDLSVRTAHLDASHGFFNGTSVYLAPAGRGAEPCSVDILRPAGARFRDWRVATTLPPAPGSDGAKRYGFGRYEAPDYDALVDHPVEMGTFALDSFDVGGCRHEIVLTGHTDVDFERLKRDLKPVCREQIRLFDPAGGRAPVDRYLFMTMAVGTGYGGLEHRASTALICSRDDLPWPGMRGVPDGYQTFLGLASHEYFHTWNVKRIKPAAFTPYDLDRENYTRLLWIFEGFTSYYDDLMLRRAGVIDTAGYLRSLQRAIRSVQAGPGRQIQSVAESSFEAWTKYYRQDENSPNAIVSYYVKGSLVALCLDLTIRARTRGRKSLDDVMRLLWARHGGPGAVGLGEQEFPSLLREATGVDLSAAIARWAYGTSELPLAECLASVGIALTKAADGEQTAWLAARTRMQDGGVVIASLDRDGPAALGGLAAGDRLVAIDGLRCDEARLKTLLARARPGQRVRVHAFRRDELIETGVELAAPPALITLAATGKPAMRDAWLGPESVVAARTRRAER